MEQIFKIIKPIRKNQFHWIDFDIEEGTVIKRVMDVSSSMDSVHGILAEIPNAITHYDIPYEYIEPMYEYKKTIILLHGKVLVNFKTGIEWSIDEKYLNGIQQLQIEIERKLKKYEGEDYTLHLATNDELLHFDEILDYLNYKEVPYKRFEYDTNHRFEKMEELLDNIKYELI